MPITNHPSKTKGYTVLDIVAYIFVFLCFNGIMGLLFFKALPLKAELDFTLIGLYLVLSLASFYYFVINDLLASQLKGRSMALGFLFAHGAFAFIGYAQVFSLPANMVWYISGGLLVAAYVFGAYGTTRFSRYNSETREKMRFNSETDALTGLFNRRFYMRYSQKLVDSSRRNSQPLSVLMFDLDDFKKVNDDLGHAAGDEVLINISRILTDNIRKSDQAYRWGGEEFLIIFPQTALHETLQIADNIIQQVAATEFAYMEHTFKLTISAGVAECRPHDTMLQNTVRRADQALYLAKQQGKNRVVGEIEYNENQSAHNLKSNGSI